MRKQLENHFGSTSAVPEKIEEAIKIGEQAINERVKMLKMVDKASWLAVDKYVADPLCKDAEDDRKWKQACKEAKEEQSKRKSSGTGYYNCNRGKDGYRSGRNYGRRDSRDRKDRYVENGGDGLEESCAGERRERAIVVADKAISRRIVGQPRRMPSPESGGTGDGKSGAGKAGKVEGGFMYDYKMESGNKNAKEKLVFDSAEEKLDKLEGKLVEDETDVCLIYKEDVRVEEKVHNTLREHVGFWKDTVALEFTVSVICNGFVPQMRTDPGKYQEKNNKSYREER